nr:hypothetical protein [Tanacetum cinerariifolium]
LPDPRRLAWRRRADGGGLPPVRSARGQPLRAAHQPRLPGGGFLFRAVRLRHRLRLRRALAHDDDDGIRQAPPDPPASDDRRGDAGRRG